MLSPLIRYQEASKAITMARRMDNTAGLGAKASPLAILSPLQVHARGKSGHCPQEVGYERSRLYHCYARIHGTPLSVSSCSNLNENTKCLLSTKQMNTRLGFVTIPETPLPALSNEIFEPNARILSVF